MTRVGKRSRRGRGEGSFRLRQDGRWEARLVVEEDGRRRQRSFFGRTKDEAARKMRNAQHRVDQNLPLPPENITVKAYLESWIVGKQATMRPESWRRYNDTVRLHLVPTLGKHKLAKLQPAHLREAYAEIGKRVSGTTVQLAHGTLHVALSVAEREGLVGRNVASLITAPRRSTAEQRHLGPDDAKALFSACQDEPLEAFFTLALLSGLRLGELQALQWRDIDLERSRLIVRRTLTGMKDEEPVYGEPKTKNSRRTVWLAFEAVSALERQKQRQDKQRADAGAVWKEYGLVFTSGLGTPLDGNNVRERSFKKLLEKAKLPPMRFHDLRHSAASLLLAEGVPVKVVSEMLGHADVSTTLRIYAHVIEGSQAQAVSVLDKLFHA